MPVIFKYNLKDSHDNFLGEIYVKSKDHMLALGDFAPNHNFSFYEGIFNDFEHAINNQLFTEVNRLEAEIAKINFYVIGPFPKKIKIQIFDLQIFGKSVSFRFK